MLVNSFDLNGYGGAYSLNFMGFLDRDYPYFKLRGGVSHFSLDEFSNDLDAPYSLGGTMDVDCDYGTGASRMFHILQNTFGGIYLNIASGQLKGVPMQRRLNEWLHKNGYTGINLNDIQLNAFNINLTQAADKYSFRRFYLSSDAADFSGYGEYGYQSGLSVPLHMVIRDKSNVRREAQVSLTGPLMNPGLRFNRKGSESLKLFENVE
jgi:hypothetical protein